MTDPKPVNLMTPSEVRAGGWAAESRDPEGHLITSHAPFDSDEEMCAYVREEVARGNHVTIFAVQ